MTCTLRFPCLMIPASRSVSTNGVGSCVSGKSLPHKSSSKCFSLICKEKMFGRGGFASNPTGEELDLFADLTDYLDDNENVPYVPLGLDDDPDLGLNIRQEAEVVEVDEDQAIIDEINDLLRIDPESALSGVDLEKLNRTDDFNVANPISKKDAKMPGKKNPSADWRTEDTSSKWWKRKQKFEIGDVDPDDVEMVELSNEDFENRLDDAIDAYHDNPKIKAADDFVNVRPTSEQMEMIELEALTLAAQEDSLAAMPLLETAEDINAVQLDALPEKWFDRAARHVKRIWNKMFGKSTNYVIDTDAVAMEMQSMGSNDLRESLLHSLEDTHDLGTHINPNPDGSYEPPQIDEFGLGDGGLEAPPAMANEAENLGSVVDRIVDAGLDAAVDVVAPVVDGALDAIPGFDAITSAVNRGASLMNPRQR